MTGFGGSLPWFGSRLNPPVRLILAKANVEPALRNRHLSYIHISQQMLVRLKTLELLILN